MKPHPPDVPTTGFQPVPKSAMPRDWLEQFFGGLSGPSLMAEKHAAPRGMGKDAAASEPRDQNDHSFLWDAWLPDESRGHSSPREAAAAPALLPQAALATGYGTIGAPTRAYDAQELQLIDIGQTQTDDTWMMSSWDAGQSSLMRWTPENVAITDEKVLELSLINEPESDGRPVTGGEIQSSYSTGTGTWSWVAQAPDMQEGSVFGMFLYKADWQNDPWLEYDFEFVGEDTTQVQINIHMETSTGEHVTLDQVTGEPVIVDLGFDASEGFHEYEITVLEDSAVFRVDDRVVGEFDASDMPVETWKTGDLKSFTDLWAVDEGLEDWAGSWDQTNDPLVARIAQLSLPAESAAACAALNLIDGGDGADMLVGTDGNDLIRGQGGNDTIRAGAGDDVIVGGTGADWMTGGAGADVFMFTSSEDAGLRRAQDVITDFEAGADMLSFVELDGDVSTVKHDQLSFSGDHAQANSAWLVDKGSELLLRIDVDGNEHADIEIALTGVESLHDGDMLF